MYKLCIHLTLINISHLHTSPQVYIIIGINKPIYIESRLIIIIIYNYYLLFDNNNKCKKLL